jgi:hypothetical protein
MASSKERWGSGKMSDAQNEVLRALREAQTKYAYFLLAAAGAGIALAVNQTRDMGLA